MSDGFPPHGPVSRRIEPASVANSSTSEEGKYTDWDIDRSGGGGIGIDTHDVSASVRNNLVCSINTCADGSPSRTSGKAERAEGGAWYFQYWMKGGYATADPPPIGVGPPVRWEGEGTNIAGFGWE